MSTTDPAPTTPGTTSGTPPVLSSAIKNYVISIPMDDPIDNTVSPDGDSVINIVFVVPNHSMGFNTPIETSPAYRIRVSSPVMRLPSAVLKDLFNIPQNSHVTVSDTCTSGVEFKTPSPRFHLAYLGNREIGLVFELKSDYQLDIPYITEVLEQRWIYAVLIILRVIHFREVPDVSFDLEQVAYVAELAWALGCLPPLEPWINLWLSEYEPPTESSDTNARSAKPDPDDLACGLIGLALNDETAFETATKAWIRCCSAKELDHFGLAHISVTTEMICEFI